MKWWVIGLIVALSGCAPPSAQSIANDPKVLKAESDSEATFNAAIKDAKSEEEREFFRKQRQISRDTLKTMRSGQSINPQTSP